MEMLKKTLAIFSEKKNLLLLVFLLVLVFAFYWFSYLPRKEKQDYRTWLQETKSGCHETAISDAIDEWRGTNYPERYQLYKTLSCSIKDSRFFDIVPADKRDDFKNCPSLPSRYMPDDYENFYQMCLRSNGIEY